MKTLKEIVEELERLERESPPGPWESDYCGDVFTKAIVVKCELSGLDMYKTIGTSRTGPDNGFGRFSAAVKNALPALLQALRLQDEKLEEIGDGSGRHSAGALSQMAREARVEVAKLLGEKA